MPEIRDRIRMLIIMLMSIMTSDIMIPIPAITVKEAKSTWTRLAANRAIACSPERRSAEKMLCVEAAVKLRFFVSCLSLQKSYRLRIVKSRFFLKKCLNIIKMKR
jgi:hypothetical protein